MTLTVGDTGRGILTVSNGGLVTSGSGIVGAQAGSVGEVSVGAAPSRWDISGTLTVGSNGTGTVTAGNGGVIQAAGIDIGTGSGTGTVSANNGLVKSTGDITVGGGTGQAVLEAPNNGTVDATGFNVHVRQNGHVRDRGNVKANDIITYNESASVEPGGVGAVGRLGFEANWDATAGVTLYTDIGADGRPDLLEVTGNVALSGTLTVTLLDGFDPPPGYTGVIVRSGTALTGQFSTLNAPTLSGGRYWALSYDSDEVFLSVGVDYEYGPMTAGGPAVDSNAPVLSEAELSPIVSEAIRRWEAALPNLDESSRTALRETVFHVYDLPENALGVVVPGVVWIDANAAGYGWFVDGTPETESEFIWDPVTEQYLASPLGPAAGRTDLLTVVMHEMGRILGYAAVDPAQSPYDLMSPVLDVGLRRLPEHSEPVLLSLQSSSTSSEASVSSTESTATSVGGRGVSSRDLMVAMRRGDVLPGSGDLVIGLAPVVERGAERVSARSSAAATVLQFDFEASRPRSEATEHLAMTADLDGLFSSEEWLDALAA